jgi:asparagine synthase (glutamine-hydrolysing)
MCGIAGILSLTDQRPEATLVERMLERMIHRGPDDQGCQEIGPVVLGMRRLSILDPTPRGHQPMSSPDGRYTIVYNGEIYNFLELADELAAQGRTFSSSSDTEVLLAAYAAWGPDCVKRLNGIWAFAIWDSRDRTLFLARDRFGVKPLYLAEGSGYLAFASEIKALRTLPWVSAEPELEVVRAYLVDGSLGRGSRTFFEDVECFPAAHSLLISSGGRKWECYWSAPALSEDPSFRAQRSDADRVEEFRSLLVDSVALQLRSDVAIGSCLSGGLDSSSIVGIAAALKSNGPLAAGRGHQDREGTPQLAFFAEFRETGIDERPYVDAVVAATGVTLHTTTPDTNLFLESLPGILHAQDEPFGSTSIVAQYHVMRIAHEAGVKVLLDGQGADELLGGYIRYTAMRFGGGLRSGNPRTMWDAARSMAAQGGPYRASLGYALIGSRRLPLSLNRRRMPANWIGRALSTSRGDRVAKVASPKGTLLARALWRDVVSDNLPDLLRYEDRNSMAFSIEARVPFLDHRLVEASLLLPDRLKVAGRGDRKIVQRRAMRGLVPDEILARRDKVAFQSPERRWLQESEPVWRKLAARSRAEDAGLLAPRAILGAIAAFAAGGSSSLLWRVLNVEMWLRDAAGEAPLA